MRAAAERTPAHLGRWPAWDAERENHLSVRRAFSHRMIAVVRTVEVTIRADVKSVRVDEDPFAPRSQEFAVAIEHDHRGLAAVKQIDLVGRAHRDRRDVAQAHARRQVSPIGLDAVAKFGVAQNISHSLALDVLALEDEA